MCRYSNEVTIEHRGIVNATKGEELVISDFRGFSRRDDTAGPVVCLLPGTELLLSAKQVDWYLPDGNWHYCLVEDARNVPVRSEEREVPIIWNANGEIRQMMDLLVRADGRYTMVHYLLRNTSARVLQLPVEQISAPTRVLENA